MLLSTDARRLDPYPYAGYLASLRVPLPVLSGVDRMNAPVPGLLWDNLKEQVAEGLEAARVAERLGRDLDWKAARWVARIDVARFPTRTGRPSGEVLLVLSDGTEVEWGRTERAGNELFGQEDTYDKKLPRLKAALSVAHPRRLDVRFPPEPPLVSGVLAR